MTPMTRRSRLVRPTMQGLAFLLLALGSGCGDPMISPMEDAGPTRCDDGYVAEGAACVDVDECALGVHDCTGALTCMNEPGGWSCLDCTSLTVTTVSTRADWSPDEIVNAGAPLTWTVSGGVTIAPVTADDPVLDLSANTGEAVITIESEDGFAGLTGFELDQAGVTGVAPVACLTDAVTFALRDNPIERIDVAGLSRIDNLTLRTGRLAALDVSSLSTLRLLYVYENQLTGLDLGENPALEYVSARDNRLTAAAQDQILLDLDEHGVSGGELLLAGNAEAPTSAAYDAYQSLVGKGWTIDIPSPSRPGEACDPGYRREGAACVDENECLGEGAGHTCEPTAICDNTPGSFTCTGCTGADCPLTVAELRAVFDDEYAQASTGTSHFSNPNIAFASDAGRQQHYYGAEWIEATVDVWQATGDDTYLERVQSWVDAMIASSTVIGPGGSNEGYRGWPSDTSEAPRSVDGTPLWESYAWRHVATLLRVMRDSPALLARDGHQAWYDATLAFLDTHIWEKWHQGGLGNLYRSRTHMASHWMLIAAELDYLTDGGRGGEYRTVWQEIAHVGMSTRPGPRNSLRANLERHDTVPSAYVWLSTWTGASDSMQDTSHASDLISNMAHMEQIGSYWTAADMQSFASTFLDLAAGPDVYDCYQFVDGTGSLTPSFGNCSYTGWMTVAAYDPRVQAALEAGVVDRDRYRPLAGVLAYNRARMNGALFYPER